jgi:hypothetical protein
LTGRELLSWLFPKEIGSNVGVNRHSGTLPEIILKSRTMPFKFPNGTERGMIKN